MMFAILYIVALAGAEQTPPYKDYALAVDTLFAQIDEQLVSLYKKTSPDLTDPRRHYSVMMHHIITVSWIISDDPDKKNLRDPQTFKEIYMESLPGDIAKGYSDVTYGVYDALAYIEETASFRKHIQKLIDAQCTDGQPKEECDQLVHQMVLNDPDEHEFASECLIYCGQVATILLKQDWVTVAKEYRVIEYLIANVDELQPAIKLVSYLMWDL